MPYLQRTMTQTPSYLDGGAAKHIWNHPKWKSRVWQWRQSATCPTSAPCSNRKWSVTSVWFVTKIQSLWSALSLEASASLKKEKERKKNPVDDMTAVSFWSHESSTQAVTAKSATRARRPSRGSAGAPTSLLFRTRDRTLHTDTFSTPTDDRLMSSWCKYRVPICHDSLDLTSAPVSHQTLC